MDNIIIIALLVLAIVYCLLTHKHSVWKKAQRMYGYFEYDYKGEFGSSRDYGPMLEIDMIGAINHRQELGATITFEVYKSNQEDMEDIIDARYHLRNQQSTRRKG